MLSEVLAGTVILIGKELLKFKIDLNSNFLKRFIIRKFLLDKYLRHF